VIISAEIMIKKKTEGRPFESLVDKTKLVMVQNITFHVTVKCFKLVNIKGLRLKKMRVNE